MKNIEPDEINSTFKILRKKLSIEIDENELVKQITQLSTEIQKLRQEKEYLESAKKLFDSILLNYSYALDNSTVRFKIPNIKREIDNSIRELIKQIMYKSEKLDSVELLLDFTSYESFNQIAEIRFKKKNK
jgi:hypothetical protein